MNLDSGGASRRRQVFLVGEGISKSISPAIQNSAFRKLDVDLEYGLLEIREKEFDSKIKEVLESKNVRGLNVTVPFKEKIIKHLSQIDPRSRAIGAVNTVKILERKILGFNTDYDGINATLDSLRKNWKGRRGVILGAGGAARACTYTLAMRGFSSIIILNRTMSRAKELTNHFRLDFPKITIDFSPFTSLEISEQIKQCDLLVNAISNRAKFPLAINFLGAKQGMRVFDLGYREPIPLLKSAKTRGLKGSNGIQMLVEQAASSIEIWTGEVAPRRYMMNAALNALRKKEPNEKK